MSGHSADILGGVTIPGYLTWPELAWRVEQRAAQVLQQAQAIASHAKPCPAQTRQVLNRTGKTWNWLLYFTIGYGYRTW